MKQLVNKQTHSNIKRLIVNIKSNSMKSLSSTHVKIKTK